MSTSTTNASGAKRFELPALSFDFASLTEGTDIPAPPKSPVIEKAPTPPKTPEKKLDAAAKTINGAAAAANGTPSSVAPTAEGEAKSNGAAAGAAAHGPRPASRSNGSIFDEKKAKRGSGFFRRLTSSNRSGNLYQQSNGSQSKPEVARGPPPPMIPELSALGSKIDVNDGGSLGDDLFKNIK